LLQVDGQSGPEAELDPAPGDLISGDCLVGQDRRVAQRDLRHARRQSQRGGAGGDRGNGRPGLEPRSRWVGPIAEVIRHRRHIETEGLDSQKPVEELRPGHAGYEHYLKPQVVAHGADATASREFVILTSSSIM
jgi:hypothetical protein